MKIAGFLAITLTLILVAPYALADVYTYPSAYQTPVYTQPDQAENQSVTAAQSKQIHPLQPCNCPYLCMQPSVYIVPAPVTVQQPPLPRTVIAQEDRTVYFGFNKVDLNNEAREKLNSLAGRLMSANDVTGTTIVGYADRIGTISYNEALSRMRTENVHSYLTDRGFIKPSPVETRWVGKSQPSTHCSKYLPRAQLLRCLQPDRKVEVKINYRTQTPPEPVD